MSLSLGTVFLSLFNFLGKNRFLFSTSFVSTVLIIETRKNGNKRRHIDPIHRWDVDRGGSCGGEKLAGCLSRKRETVGAGLFYDSRASRLKVMRTGEPGRGVVSVLNQESIRKRKD